MYHNKKNTPKECFFMLKNKNKQNKINDNQTIVLFQ